jgi:hypothetical protein
MGRWVIAVLATGIGLLAVSARAEVVLAPTVYASRKLPSDAITTFAVACPAGHFAVGAGVSAPAAGTALLKAAPASPRAYTFSLGNPGANGAKRVTAAVACRKVRPGGPRLALRPVRATLTVGRGTQRSAALPCPPKTTPAGSGVDLDPGRARRAAPFAGAALELRAATASLHGFAFTVRNAGHRLRRAVVYGNCLTVVRSAGAPPTPLRVRITTFTDSLHAGRQRLGHGCPPGWFSLGAGYAVSSAAVRVVGAAPLGRGGRWWVENAAGGAGKVDLQLVCGSLGG